MNELEKYAFEGIYVINEYNPYQPSAELKKAVMEHNCHMLTCQGYECTQKFVPEKLTASITANNFHFEKIFSYPPFGMKLQTVSVTFFNTLLPAPKWLSRAENNYLEGKHSLKGMFSNCEEFSSSESSLEADPKKKTVKLTVEYINEEKKNEMIQICQRIIKASKLANSLTQLIQALRTKNNPGFTKRAIAESFEATAKATYYLYKT